MNHHVCSAPSAGNAGCNALRHDPVDSAGKPANPAATTPAPAGFGPADVQSAYNLPGTARSGMTVAIVDAYDRHAPKKA